MNVALLRAVLARASDAPLRDAHLQVAGSLAEARACLVRESFDIVLLTSGCRMGVAWISRASSPGHPSGRGSWCSPRTPCGLTRRPPGAAGADAFVAKPYQPDTLMVTLRDLTPEGVGSES